MYLGLDHGYGGNKFAYRDNENKIKFGKKLSVFADAPQDAEDMPLFEGKRYYIGEMALMEDSNSIKNNLDYKDHETMAPLSTWQVLKEENINVNDIKKIGIGLSLAQKDYANQFIKRLSKFTVDNEKFDLKDKIVLIPQAIGAKFAIDHLYEGENSTYAIFDIGQLTVDRVNVINGKVRKENASGAAHDGIIKIIQELQEFIASNEEIQEHLSIKEIQEILVSGKYIIYGEEFDFSEKIEELKTNYTKYLIPMIKKQFNNIFKKYSKIYFVGGGSYYLDKEETMRILGLNEKTLIFPDNAEYLNAIGNLLAAEISDKNNN